MQTLDRITFNPAVMSGETRIRGMWITVGNIANFIFYGCTVAEILEEFPLLEEEDIRQVLAYSVSETAEIDIPFNYSQCV